MCTGGARARAGVPGCAWGGGVGVPRGCQGMCRGARGMHGGCQGMCRGAKGCTGWGAGCAHECQGTCRGAGACTGRHRACTAVAGRAWRGPGRAREVLGQAWGGGLGTLSGWRGQPVPEAPGGAGQRGERPLAGGSCPPASAPARPDPAVPLPPNAALNIGLTKQKLKPKPSPLRQHHQTPRTTAPCPPKPQPQPHPEAVPDGDQRPPCGAGSHPTLAAPPAPGLTTAAAAPRPAALGHLRAPTPPFPLCKPDFSAVQGGAHTPTHTPSGVTFDFLAAFSRLR